MPTYKSSNYCELHGFRMLQLPKHKLGKLLQKLTHSSINEHSYQLHVQLQVPELHVVLSGDNTEPLSHKNPVFQFISSLGTCQGMIEYVEIGFQLVVCSLQRKLGYLRRVTVALNFYFTYILTTQYGLVAIQK